MTDNIIKFPGSDEYDLNILEEQLGGPSLEVSEVLEGLKGREFDDIVVLGTYSTKSNLYFASTSGDPAKVLWDLERAKHVLMELFMSSEDPLDQEL